MRRSRSRTIWLSALGWLFGLATFLLPALASAQSYTLQVTLRDSTGAAIVGVSLIVRTEDGEELARQVTDRDGAAHFGSLSGVVRVLVDGQPRGGPRLYQLGDDARGVRVDLDQAALPLTLNLRAEPDGLVLPDPATMLTLEEGGPIVVDTSPIPTAALATPAPLPTTRRTAITPSGSGSLEGEPPPQAGWVPPVTLLIIVVAAVLLRLVQKLRSTR
ncbi:MAG: hypothetical protein OHK0015_35970 [Chloroflexi bacterium OHK40]